MNKMLAI